MICAHVSGPLPKERDGSLSPEETCTSKSLPIRTQEKLAQSEELSALVGRQRPQSTLPALAMGEETALWEITPANFNPKWVTGPHTRSDVLVTFHRKWACQAPFIGRRWRCLGTPRRWALALHACA